MSIRGRLLRNIQTQLVLTSVASGVLASFVVILLSRALVVPQLPSQAFEELNARPALIEHVLSTGGDAAELRRAVIPASLPPDIHIQLVRFDGAVVVESSPAAIVSDAQALPGAAPGTLQFVNSIPIVVNDQVWGNYVAGVRLGPPGFGSPGMLALVFAIGLLVFALPFWWFGRQLANSLLALTRVVGRIAHGDLAARAAAHPRIDELGQLAYDVNTMAASLQEAQTRLQVADETRRIMVASISHDLRTPLTALVAHAEALHAGMSEDAARSVEVIHSRAMRLKSLIEDLFELAALDASPGPWPTCRLDLAELVREGVAAAIPDLEAAGLEVEVDIPEEQIWAPLSPGKLERVLDNLLANARTYGAGGGWLRVRVCRPSVATARVEVIDGGEGIPAADRAHIFERFYRADGARGAASGGSGLGLSISHEIILRHAGRIGVECPASGGTCVWFEVPVSAD
jgi:signal transduction histidine kinase